MAEQEKPVAPAKPVEPPKKMEFKLLGHNYVTPDLVAKVTGRARYAEDFRAEGMAFIKLMPSPRPHAKIRSIDDSAALAMEGVLGILTAKDLPPPPAPPGGGGGAPAAGRGGAAAASGAAGAPAASGAAGATGNPPARGAASTGTPGGTPPPQAAAPGTGGAPAAPAPAAGAAPVTAAPPPPPMPPEFALTMEPVYEGEPILAVAALTEEIASAAIEKIVIDWEPLPFVTDPIESLRPGSPNGRSEGNVFVGASMRTIKWTPEQMARYDAGKFPHEAEATETALFGDVEKGFKEADLIVE